MALTRHSIAWRILAAQLVTALTLSLTATVAATWWSLDNLRDRQLSNLERVMVERTERVSSLFFEIEEAHQFALSTLRQTVSNLDSSIADREFDALFPLQDDGTRRSTDVLFEGYVDARGEFHSGVAAFMYPDAPASPEDRRWLVSAYHVVDSAGSVLSGQIRNIYFFSPRNELIISAPTRSDRLMFYRRDADTGFDLREADFAPIVTIEANPEGRFVCGELTQLVSVRNREALTTGCFTPVRDDGVHIGAIGTTIPMSGYFAEALAGDHLGDGMHPVFFNGRGQLIAHGSMLERDVTQDVIDHISEQLGLPDIWDAVREAGTNSGRVTSRDGRWEIAFSHLAGPDWYFATLVDRDIMNGDARNQAIMILSLGALGIILQGLVLFYILYRQVVGPIRRLTDIFSETDTGSKTGAEIHALSESRSELGVLTRTLNHYREMSQQNVDELERRVAERTEALEKANRAKSDFLSTMSHELRTPLNGIIGLSQTLEEMLDDTAQRSMAGMIHTSGENLGLLLNDILDMSKIEAGKLELSLKSAELHETLREVHALFAQQAASSGIAFDLVIDDTVPAMGLIDTLRLRQILSNLVSNAIKFTAKGHVKIRATAAPNGDKRALISIAVEDTGIGMSEAVRERLFKPFSQADSDTASRFGGTGLGLYISIQLAKLMKGNIEVTSREGEGSCFTFRFDMACVDKLEESPTQKTPAELAALPEFEALNGLNILLVEDNMINRQVASAFLKPLGGSIIDAENGAVALERLETDEIDLVLMDVRMPVMDGFEATKRIRESGRPWATCPIVALTANAGEDDARACFDAGMDAFSTKPLSPYQLFEAMRSALEVRSVARDALEL